MLRRSRSSDPRAEEGSASVEFLVVGLLLIVPLAYLTVTLGIVQSRTLGAESAARHVARSMATAENADDARQRGEIVLRALSTEYGLDPDSIRIELHCRPATSACPTAGATITVTVATTAEWPFVPPILGLDQAARVPIVERATAKVSRFWATT